MTTEETSESGVETWASRNGWAWLLRVVLLVLPVAASALAVLSATRVLPRPVAVVPAIAWFAGVVALGTLVMRWVDRSLQRFLPIVMLLRLSLVFPDKAPSRFKLMLKQGTTRQLRRDVDAGALSSGTQQAAEELLMLVAELGNHDRLTRGHSERVRAYSDLIAEEMDLTQRERERLHWAALLHDVGKLSVPAEVLNKSGKPTADDWTILRGHPAAASMYLAPLASWLGDWCSAAFQHHEHWDGGGYPDGLEGEKIHLAGRIVAVADAYDTITSIRSYKKATSPHDARIELARCSGSQFDPAVIRAFLNVSVGHLRRVMGPLAWLSHLPLLLTAPAAIPAVTGAVAVTSAAAMIALSGALVPPPEPAQPEITAAAAGPELDLAFVDDEARTAPPTPTAEPRISDSSPLEVSAATPPPATPQPATTPSPLPTESVETPTAPTVPTPTPTSLPTPASTVAPEPTPTVAPEPTIAPVQVQPVSTLYLTNPGSGDTVSSLLLALSRDAPTESALSNYDTDSDSDPGLLLKETGKGVEETNPSKSQLWAIEIGAQDLSGLATVRLHSAIRDYQEKSATLAVRIQSCAMDLSSCSTLGEGETRFSQGEDSDFHTVVVAVPVSGGTSTTQPNLVLKVVTGPSERDVWLAYDTTSHAARVVFGQ